MFGFGVLWLVLGAYDGRLLPEWVRIALWLAGIVLAVGIGVRAMRSLRLAKTPPPSTPEQTAAGRRTGRRFGMIFGLEGLAIAGAVAILNAVHRPQAIVLAVAIIVGLHFFPLARIFHVPMYYVTGAVGCLIGIVGFWIGDLPLRGTFVGLSFGLLLWITSVIVLLRPSESSTREAAIGSQREGIG